MKGVDLNCIKLVANRRYKGGTEEERIFKLYEDLYQGEPIEFDLCEVRVRMEMTKQQRIINKTSMVRCLMFKGKKRKYVQK